jgi:putative DNA primase/helicase
MDLRNDVKTITEKYGPPGYENEKGKLSRLNENFWAAYYARQKEKIIYEPGEQEFYEFDPGAGIFVPKSSDLIRKELSAMILEGAQQWDGFNALEQFRNERPLSGVLKHLRGIVEERDFFCPPCHSVHLGNCTLKFSQDGSDFTTEGFSPSHRSRNRSPINYQPGADCPKFREHMLGHLGEDDRLLLQKYAGQCLLGRNLTQRFVLLDGIGGASKGSFVLTINGIIGQKNVYELRTEQLAQRFEIGRMIRRTLLVGSDVKGNFLEHPSAHRIKSLVGGDLLEAELKGSNHRFEIYGIFNLLISSNTRLHLRVEGDL